MADGSLIKEVEVFDPISEHLSNDDETDIIAESHSAEAMTSEKNETNVGSSQNDNIQKPSDDEHMNTEINNDKIELIDMIQTHLIICKDWAETKDKAKSLEHIIRKCDPPTPAMPLVTTGTEVPGLYSHIAHSVDKEEAEIPPPFKGAKPKQTRGRGKSKGKPQGHRQNPPKDRGR